MMASWIRLPLPLVALLFLAVPVIGCLSDKAKSTDPPAACAKAGDPCTFSPGKLGLCIEPIGGKAAPVCQSQH